MKLEITECPSCGANAKLDASLERGYCENCKNDFINPEAIKRHKKVDITQKIEITEKIEHTGKVEVEGISTGNNLLSRASQYLDANDFDNAIKTFKKVLELDAEDHRAWWGVYVCEAAFADYYRRLYGESMYAAKWVNTVAENLYNYAYKAISYAPEDVAANYRQSIREEEQLINDYRNGKFDDRNQQKNSSGFCYVATAVYGSYDAPEVLVLRKFRDNVLKKFVLGRGFIRFYYFVGPTLTRFLRDASIINKAVKRVLDGFVYVLSKR